jgi:transcriptional regulator with XRE-family HTH domain
MENDVPFGTWLRRKRKALDLTQTELADRVGCSFAAIRKFETEERRPSAQITERLAHIFGVAPHEQDAFLRFARGDWQSAPTALPKKNPGTPHPGRPVRIYQPRLPPWSGARTISPHCKLIYKMKISAWLH